MIQDIEPKQMRNQFQERQPKATDKVMIFRDGKLAVKGNPEEKGDLDFLSYSEIEMLYQEKKEEMPQLHYLFAVSENAFFLMDSSQALVEQIQKKNTQMIVPRQLRGQKPLEHVFAGTTAWHLHQWYAANRFCGKCGHEMEHDTRERMMHCPACGNRVYPRVNPAVIVGVRDNEQMVLTRYAGRSYKRYALIAGFVEIGETLEETVAREVMEEVGLKVKNITYYKSQPWGFDSDILMGFYCDVDGDRSIKMDEDELATAEWMDYQQIPEDQEGLSLTAEMMQIFKREQEKKKNDNSGH